MIKLVCHSPSSILDFSFGQFLGWTLYRGMPQTMVSLGLAFLWIVFTQEIKSKDDWCSSAKSEYFVLTEIQKIVSLIFNIDFLGWTLLREMPQQWLALGLISELAPKYKIQDYTSRLALRSNFICIWNIWTFFIHLIKLIACYQNEILPRVFKNLPRIWQ